MRCIETGNFFVSWFQISINSNMRCIETYNETTKADFARLINSNMRCIETDRKHNDFRCLRLD